jgi:hypothetical protein
MTLDFVTRWWWVLLLALVVLVVVAAAVILRRRRAAENAESLITKSNIKRVTLDCNLKWDTAPDEALTKIYEYVIGASDSTIYWYRARRRPKRQLGFGLRLGALLLTGGAGLVPITPIPPVWSTVMIAVAGLCVSIDVFAGHTSGWVRYMLAEQKVERVKDAFLLEWNALRVANADVPGMLDRAKTFLLTVGKIVDDETQEWAADFQNSLKEMEKARKAAAESERAGALEITVKNPKTVTEWILEIDGSQRGRTSGRSIAITDVAVGLHKLKVYGDDPLGQRFSDEKAVKIDGGTTVTKELELT